MHDCTYWKMKIEHDFNELRAVNGLLHVHASEVRPKRSSAYSYDGFVRFQLVTFADNLYDLPKRNAMQ